MGVVLDHTILRVADLDESVGFYRDVMGFAHLEPFLDWQVMGVNDDLVIDLDQGDPAPSRHLAFAMDRDTFDATFARIKAAGVPYGDGPHVGANMKGPGRSPGARGMADSVYLKDPSGHFIEIRVY